jgi:hypothetical protein
MDKKIVILAKLCFQFMSIVPNSKITDILQSRDDLSDSEKKNIVNSVSFNQKHILFLAIFTHCIGLFLSYLLVNILKVHFYFAIFMSLLLVSFFLNLYRNVLLLKKITKEKNK